MNSNDIINETEKLFNAPTPKSLKIPAPLVANGRYRKGISYIDLSSKLLGIMADNGFKVGTNVDGTPDFFAIYTENLFKVLIEALKYDAAFTVSIPPGIKITGSGGNAGGPVQVVGQSIYYATGSAVLQ